MSDTRPAPMSDFMLEQVARRFRALADRSRLLLMNLLCEGEHNVGELVEGSKLTNANVSKHLKVLHRAGFVRRRKAGLNVYYSLANHDVEGLCHIMCSMVQQEIERALRLARGEVEAERP